MNHTHKRIPLGALLCALSMTAVGAMGQGQPMPDTQPVPTAPLSRDDPRAQLDPWLLNVPPAVRPAGRTLSRLAPPSREIEFDPITRQTRVGSRPVTLNARIQGAPFAPGHPGLDANVQSEPAKGGDRLNYVFGTDDRTKITPPTSYPWRTQANLYSTFPDGYACGCSGTMIGYYNKSWSTSYVLTAGHCVYNSSHGGWAKYVEVIPGLDGVYKPYGSFWMTKMRSYTGWTVSASPDHDFALVSIKGSTIASTTGWLGYGYFSSIVGVTGNLAAYPADKGIVYQYYDYDPILVASSKRVYYWIDTYAGTSGGGVYKITSSGNRYVFAVNAYEISLSGSPWYNSGTRIDSAKFNSIKSWIASGT